jgi:hypothetical protein
MYKYLPRFERGEMYILFIHPTGGLLPPLERGQVYIIYTSHWWFPTTIRKRTGVYYLYITPVVVGNHWWDV